jgi:hypothetical protein
MPALSTITVYTIDNDLVTAGTITASEHNTHRANSHGLHTDYLAVLKDLEKNFTSASAPSDTPTGKIWHDSSNGVLKYYDGAAWITLHDSSDSLTSNLITGGKINIDVDGTAKDTAGAMTFGTGQDFAIFFDGTNFLMESGDATTVIEINNTAADGDPAIAFSLSDTQVFTIGVDDGDSDKFKIGTTAIGTNTRITIDANGEILVANVAYSALTTLTFDATQDWNLRTAQVATVTLTANVTFDAPTNQVAGATYIIICVQDGTGSRTIAWNSAFIWGTGGAAPTATTTAGDADVFVFISDGTNMYANEVLEFDPV